MFFPAALSAAPQVLTRHLTPLPLHAIVTRYEGLSYTLSIYEHARSSRVCRDRSVAPFPPEGLKFGACRQRFPRHHGQTQHPSAG